MAKRTEARARHIIVYKKSTGPIMFRFPTLASPHSCYTSVVAQLNTLTQPPSATRFVCGTPVARSSQREQEQQRVALETHQQKILEEHRKMQQRQLQFQQEQLMFQREQVRIIRASTCSLSETVAHAY
jgi:hypothetical protein